MEKQDLSPSAAKIKQLYHAQSRTGDVILIRRKRKKNFKRVTPFPRRPQRSFGMTRLITVSGAILFCFLLAVAAVQMFQHRRLQKELAAAELRLARYESEIEEINEEIARLHEPGYIEVLARKWLGLVKPGEIVFQFED